MSRLLLLLLLRLASPSGTVPDILHAVIIMMKVKIMMMQVSMLMIIAAIIMMAMIMMRLVQMTSIQFEYRQVSEEMFIQAFTQKHVPPLCTLQQEIMLTGLQYSRLETPLPCLALLWLP